MQGIWMVCSKHMRAFLKNVLTCTTRLPYREIRLLPCRRFLSKYARLQNNIILCLKSSINSDLYHNLLPGNAFAK